MRIFLTLFLMSSFLFASSDLELALERWQKYANHSFAPLHYNPFEDISVIVPSGMDLTNQPVTKGQIVLKSIFNNRAFINGAWRSLGDSIGDYRVVLIENDRVILEKNGKKESFSLQDGKRNFFNLEKGSQ